MESVLEIIENTHNYFAISENGEKILHREDGPAYVYFWSNGQPKLEVWYFNGLRHRESNPAVIEYYENGLIREKQWYANEEQHRLDGPAWTVYKEDGSVSTEYYMQNNLLFRENDLPTIVNY
jgi:antitoxin component YwqK of YwqJK toxin-antitoxin module